MRDDDTFDRDARERPRPRKRTSREAEPQARSSRSAASRSARTARETEPTPRARTTRSAGEPAPRARVGRPTGGAASKQRNAKSSAALASGAGTRPAGVKGRKDRQRKKMRKGWRIFWRVALISMLVGFVATAIVGYWAYQRIVDDLPDLDQPLAALAEKSIIYDRNGDVLVELHAEQNRTYVELASIPVALREAVIATEDQRFYEHEGVDPLGIARALWVDVTEGKRHGGSTITQQYVVNTFLARENTLVRKVKEAILAYRLEKNYTKDEILEKYLNTIYYGHGAYGVQAAAEVYFGKSVGDLTVAECAMIAGVIKSPGTYTPRNDPEVAKNRRDTVLGQMLDMEFIDKATHDAAVAEVITLAAPAPTDIPAPYFVEWVKQTLIDEYGPDAVYKGGLRVKTTIDPAMQAAAETAITSILNKADDPSASIVAIDPRTGEVKALVGGKDFNTQQFNIAVQGYRQPGSSFKPFVLVTALEAGVSPEQTFESGPARLTIPGGQTWKVTGSSAGGPMRLRQATVKSINSVFAQLILQVGADKVVEMGSRLGLTTDIMPVPAIALGGLDRGVTPLEMASAYGTLANGGVHMPAYGIVEVKSIDGEILYTAPGEGTEAVSPAIAYLATDILKGVISGGTGTAAKIGRPAAGKTGTTQAYRDAWFVGYTPELVTAVWMGYPEGQIEMTNVHGRKVTGGSFPAEIWASFMKAALKDVPATDFVRPKGLTTETICLESGQLATEYCSQKGSALFLAGVLPDSCELHAGPVVVEVPNLIGKMKNDAIALLQQLGLGYAVEERPVKGVPAGMVADQNPKYPSEVATGTVVTIIVSTGEAEEEPPLADFEWSPKNPKAGDPVTFDGSGSMDPDGTIVTWSWEFSDGSPLGNGETVTHTFTTAGTYEITLWVTDDDGLVSNTMLTIEIKNP
jgi:penicillin-binding protein 1A